MVDSEQTADTIIMVPVRYPLKAPGTSTLERAIELSDQVGPAHIYVFHVNLLHKDKHTSREELSRAVTQAVGPLPDASYNIQNGFLLEETILHEAVQLKADYVVIGKTRRARWKRLLRDIVPRNVDLETFLQTHLDSELVVVQP